MHIQENKLNISNVIVRHVAPMDCARTCMCYVCMFQKMFGEIEYIIRLSQIRGTDGLRKDMYVLCVYVSENVWRN